MAKTAVMHKRTSTKGIKFAGRCVDVFLKEKTEEIIEDSENAN